jgi:polyhydroxyalkanoate synthesis regulator phasin
MDEPARSSTEGAERDPFDKLGALLGPRVDELRALLDELAGRWRGDAVRVGENTRQRLGDLFHELGLITREDWDELELRVAQLEHRLRLLEEKGEA